ncbi:MAG: tetratricopeptide repeat protein [Myxococcota bacterium]
MVLALAVAVCGGCVASGGRNEPVPPDDRHVSLSSPESLAAAFEDAAASGALGPEKCRALAGDFQRWFERTGDPKMAFNAGVVWERCGEDESAARAYHDAASTQAGFAAAHNNLGALAYREDRVDDAIRHYQDALRVDVYALSPRHNLAHAYRERYLNLGSLDAFAKAERQLQAVLAIESDNVRAYEGLARLYYDRAHAGDRSYGLLARVVITQGQRILDEQGRASAELWNLRGLLAVLHEEPSRALRAFEKAIEADPEHLDARLNAALIDLRLRNFSAADEHLVVASKLADGERALETALARGVAKRGRGDYAAAEAAYAKAHQFGPSDPRAHYNLGILYQEHLAPNVDSAGLREVDLAKRHFERFIESAAGQTQHAATVAEAKHRIANIDEYVDVVQVGRKVEAEALRLEVLERQAREARRLELLELERKAQDALDAAGSTGNSETP